MSARSTQASEPPDMPPKTQASPLLAPRGSQQFRSSHRNSPVYKPESPLHKPTGQTKQDMKVRTPGVGALQTPGVATLDGSSHATPGVRAVSSRRAGVRPPSRPPPHAGVRFPADQAGVREPDAEPHAGVRDPVEEPHAGVLDPDEPPQAGVLPPAAEGFQAGVRPPSLR